MKKKILIVDKILLDKNINNYEDLINIFPTEINDGAYRSTIEDLKQLSFNQSNFYNSVFKIFFSTFSNKKQYSKEEFRIIYYQYIIRFSNLLIDHFIRINYRLADDVNDYNVISVDEINTNDSHTTLLKANSSWQLNQLISMKISNCLGIKSIAILDKNQYPEIHDSIKIKNVIFAPYGSFIINLIRRLNTLKILASKFFGRIINNRNKILSTGFSSDEYYFAKNGAYGPLGFFYRIRNEHPAIIRENKNNELRKYIKKTLQNDLEEFFNVLMKKIDPKFTTKRINKFYLLWINLLVDWFPIYLLENYEQNINNYNSFLKKNNFKKKIIGEASTLIDNDKGLMISLSVKNLKGSLIGLQHSAGHFGYINDLSYANNYEFNHYDHYLTFGWKKTNSYLPKTNFIEMPCPKLSSYNLTSKKYLNTKLFYKKKDILFLSNTISRFPMGGTCGHSRIDFIDDILKNQNEIIKKITSNKITIVHKPYNRRLTLLFNKHFEKLKQIDSKFYEVESLNQKGLTKDLINKAKIILWDQIGSGTVELFANKVPSIIFWKRIYSEEAEWSVDYINALKDTGVLHDNLDKLLYEIKKYIDDPIEWMNNTDRIIAINNFCKEYARYDKKWYNIWRNNVKIISENEY